jgi:mRNA-degrading endonuclease toxin of MazEF toxin-antitoxin module
MWVVVSRDAFNRASPEVIACPLTSQPPGPADVTIAATPENRLRQDSTIRVHLITAIKKSDLRPAAFRVSAKHVRKVLDGLALLIEP